MQAPDLLLLLDLSTATATVRNQAALCDLLAQRLQPLFGFYTATVLVSQANQPHRHLAVAGIPDAANVFAAPPAAPPTNDVLYDWLLQQPTGRQLELTDVLAVAPGYPGLRQLQEAGVVKSCGVVLRCGERPIGYLWLYYQAGQVAKRQLTLLGAVAELLAGAVANVLVHEQVELVQRRLAPGAAGSPLRTRAQLAQLVVESFRQLLSFDASCLVAYDQDLGYDWFYLGDLPPAVTEDEAVRAYYPQQRPRPDLAAHAGRAQWVAEPAITFCDRAQLEHIGERGYPVLRAALRAGVQESLFLHLRLGDQPVGALFLYAFRAGHFAPYFPLFKHFEELLEPVALGVSHGLAYEALHAANQEKAFQLAVGQALMSSPDQRQLFAAVAQALGAVVPWDLFCVTQLANRDATFRLRKDPAGRLLPPEGAEELRDAASLDEATYDQALLALEDLYDRPGVYTGKEFRALDERYLLARVTSRLYGLRSALYLSLPPAGGQALVLTLGSRHPYGLSEAHLNLLLRLLPQIVLTLQNQAAFAEIVALKQQLEAEKTYLVQEIQAVHNFEEIVGDSPVLQQVFRSVDQVAPTETTVLILGETGTGKELIARALHHRSPRRARVLVKVDCASLPPNLIESELFGHEKGAFTGAVERRIGKFELANKGTIFLDEIGELPLELQAKLLRVLQEREIERVGGTAVLKVDVRVVAATNRVLATEVAAGRFRADLYYRLSVFPIALPALRERPEDIPLLATFFGEKFARRLNRPFRGLREGCLAQLLAYSWPGNVRELENIIEHAVIVSDGQPLDCQRLLLTFPVAGAEPSARSVAPNLSEMRAEQDQRERARIEAVLLQTHWRIRGAGGAAAVLQIKPTTLEARMKRLAIQK